MWILRKQHCLENENLVRVMSIHKSKGLEFPVVFVAGMDKKINLMDVSGDVIIDKDLGIGTNAIYMDKRALRHQLVSRQQLVQNYAGEYQ